MTDSTPRTALRRDQRIAQLIEWGVRPTDAVDFVETEAAAQARTEALDVERWEKAMRRVGMPPGDGSSWLPYVMAVAAEYEATR